MIVEFIGSTGAGKTTLISRVWRRLAQVTDVTTSFDLVAPLPGLPSVNNPTVRNFIQELLGFPFLIRSLRRHQTFLIFILRMLARQAAFSIFTFNILRSIERKIGVYEILRRRHHDRIVLVDEGTVLLAHNVFVYSSADYTREEIVTFASLVPLPDIIIYIKVPVDILVQRSLLRADPPREIRSKDRELIEKYVHRAVEMFDQLIQADNIQSRLLIVENLNSEDQESDDVVESIVRFIINRKFAIQDG